jgi:colanic acid biosynthesis glycosyl transferase WcaI
MFLDKPDVIYANTWPIFAQGLLALVCWLRCVPLILSVQDIYPESLSIQSRIGSARGGLFRFLRWIDQKTKQNSAGIVVISEKFKRIYVKNRRVPAEKLHVIPNWIDEQQVEINPELNHVRCSHNIPDDAFLVMYAGNVSAASGLDTVIKAFQNLEAEPRIYLLVAGSGSKLLEWRALAQKIANPRILFHTPWLDSETSGMLAAADLFMLPTYGDQSLVSVPSKLITYMLAARPILCCAADNSDIARTVGHAACGWTIPVGNPNLVAQMLITLSQEPADELRRFGRQGRNYALRHMTRGANLPRLVNLIQSVEQRRPFHPERLADKGDVL